MTYHAITRITLAFVSFAAFGQEFVTETQFSCPTDDLVFVWPPATSVPIQVNRLGDRWEASSMADEVFGRLNVKNWTDAVSALCASPQVSGTRPRYPEVEFYFRRQADGTVKLSILRQNEVATYSFVKDSNGWSKAVQVPIPLKTYMETEDEATAAKILIESSAPVKDFAAFWNQFIGIVGLARQNKQSRFYDIGDKHKWAWLEFLDEQQWDRRIHRWAPTITYRTRVDTKVAYRTAWTAAWIFGALGLVIGIGLPGAYRRLPPGELLMKLRLHRSNTEPARADDTEPHPDPTTRAVQAKRESKIKGDSQDQDVPQITEMQKLLEDLRLLPSKVGAPSKDVAAKLAETSRDLATLNQKADLICSQIKTLQLSPKELVTTIAEVQTTVRSDVATLAKSFGDIENRLASHVTAAVRNLQSEDAAVANAARALYQTMETSPGDVKAWLRVLPERLRDAGTASRGLQSRIDEYQKVITELRGQLSEKDAKFADVTKRGQQLQKLASVLQVAARISPFAGAVNSSIMQMTKEPYLVGILAALLYESLLRLAVASADGDELLQDAMKSNVQRIAVTLVKQNVHYGDALQKELEKAWGTIFTPAPSSISTESHPRAFYYQAMLKAMRDHQALAIDIAPYYIETTKDGRLQYVN